MTAVRKFNSALYIFHQGSQVSQPFERLKLCVLEEMSGRSSILKILE